MKPGTYGLEVAMPASGKMPSLQQIGQRTLDQGMGLAGAAAAQEQSRDAANAQQEQANSAGNAQIGSTLGAAVGSIWGPLGAAVGGTLGGMVGGLF